MLTTKQPQLKTKQKQKSKKIKAPKSVEKGKKFKITVTLNKKVKGKYVYVVINGKTYKAKTNSKGVAKFTIKKSALKGSKIGKNKIPIIFD